MSTALAIFVKTPALSPVKTRLAAGIGKENAHKFYRLSLKAIEHLAQQCDVTPYWAVGEKDGLYDPLWDRFQCLHTGEGGLGTRQHHIYSTLLKHHDTAILIGADAPQITPTIIDDAKNDAKKHDFVFGPAHDGGYYLFAGTKPIKRSIWGAVPWSHNTTRATFEGLLPKKPHHLKPLTDVDTLDDLKILTKEMPSDINAAQQGLCDWIETIL